MAEEIGKKHAGTPKRSVPAFFILMMPKEESVEGTNAKSVLSTDLRNPPFFFPGMKGETL